MTQEAIGRQLRSTVKKEGILELSLARVPTPEPKPDEVVVRIDATPINPSDLGLMLAGPGTAAAEGASCFVNPLTALGMVETMRAEGHAGLVHTVAASNLSQMLVKICVKDGIPLVNVVRRQEHVDLLEGLGAEHVLNSGTPTFMDELIEALAATGATLAFDAIGGGKLASQVLSCMEAAANRTAGGYSRYGSTKHKQVYIYGGLDRGPTELTRHFGMGWGIGGWLLTTFLQKIRPASAQKLRERGAAEINTTFASRYDKEVSLAEALRLEE